jgi:hypothetical protein
MAEAGITGRILICFLFLLIQEGMAAQIIDNRQGNFFNEEGYFNQEFIWQNKIGKITVTSSLKKPGKTIEQKPDLHVFHFNEVGLLVQLDKVVSVLQRLDTSTIHFDRNELGLIQEKGEKSRRGYFITQFVYDRDAKLIRTDYRSAENISTQKNQLVAGDYISLNSETYTWSQPKKGILIRNNFNNYGLLYSIHTIERDSNGYLLRERDEWVMNSKTEDKIYQYDRHGWVSQCTSKNNANPVEIIEKFTYDALGNLQRIDRFEGNKQLEEIEVLYTDTMLIEAVLYHDLESHEIRIYKYSYELRK